MNWLEIRGSRLIVAVGSQCEITTSLGAIPASGVREGERWSAPDIHSSNRMQISGQSRQGFNFLGLGANAGLEDLPKLQLFEPAHSDSAAAGFIVGGGFRRVTGCNNQPGVGLVWNTTSSTLYAESFKASCQAATNVQAIPQAVTASNEAIATSVG